MDRIRQLDALKKRRAAPPAPPRRAAAPPATEAPRRTFKMTIRKTVVTHEDFLPDGADGPCLSHAEAGERARRRPDAIVIESETTGGTLALPERTERGKLKPLSARK